MEPKGFDHFYENKLVRLRKPDGEMEETYLFRAWYVCGDTNLGIALEVSGPTVYFTGEGAAIYDYETGERMFGMRTLAEVDALWPNVDQYTFVGNVVIEAHNPQGVAGVIQKLYEGSEAVAGEFVVGNPTGTIGNEKTFPIVFTRNVCDDKDVVEPRLREGGELRKVLAAQMQQELANAIKETGLRVFIYLTDGPNF